MTSVACSLLSLCVYLRQPKQTPTEARKLSEQINYRDEQLDTQDLVVTPSSIK